MIWSAENKIVTNINRHYTLGYLQCDIAYSLDYFFRGMRSGCIRKSCYLVEAPAAFFLHFHLEILQLRVI
jgi:hypothetical protein